MWVEQHTDQSEWWQRRIRANAGVFHSRVRDMQTNFLIPGTISDTKARNAGKARIQGFELDLSARVLPGLTLLMDYGFLDAKVLEVIDNETGERMVIDTASRRWRRAHQQMMASMGEQRDRWMRRSSIDCIHVQTGRHYVDELVKFFRKREVRR